MFALTPTQATPCSPFLWEVGRVAGRCPRDSTGFRTGLISVQFWLLFLSGNLDKFFNPPSEEWLPTPLSVSPYVIYRALHTTGSLTRLRASPPPSPWLTLLQMTFSHSLNTRNMLRPQGLRTGLEHFSPGTCNLVPLPPSGLCPSDANQCALSYPIQKG